MSIPLLVRKEFVDSMRSRGLWTATALLTVVASAAVFLPSVALDSVDPVVVPQYMLTPVTTFVSITALVTGYLAIAGERDTGSIKTLFGLPYTRRDVVVGKYLGRAAVVSVAVLVSFVVAGVVGVAMYGSLPYGSYVRLGALTVVLAVAFVGIAVAISAGAASRSRAMTLAVGAFFVFELLWSTLVKGVYYVVTLGDLPGVAVPGWYVFLQRASPGEAFKTVAGTFLPGDVEGVQVSTSGGAQGASGASGAAPTLAERLGGEVPLYLDDWFALVVLGCWLVVPIVVGYLRFERADLG
ncbi:ABC transporter permease subunit [Halorussus halobius]|uniref:ABC transporter permease subunit n=1 Tax=Halorussus halobius TaxID=1710537 RepID=UPI001093059F|nr:ABC transporter permease subunit [Halorussus halobius]